MFKQLFFVAAFFTAILVITVQLDLLNSETFHGEARVVDGDTLVLHGVKLRLVGVDAPELSQLCGDSSALWPCGQKATEALRSRIGNNDVECHSRGIDQYERPLVVCHVADRELNAWMVQNGWAVNYGGYGDEEAIARNSELGIWAGDFVVPEQWRRQNREINS